MNTFKFGWFLRASAITTCLLVAPQVLAAQTAPPAAQVSSSVRLSPDQYRQSMIDIFGPAIKLAGRFEPGVREDGMLAVGARKVGVTDSGLDRYDELARGVASQVVSPAYRGTFVPWRPKVANSTPGRGSRGKSTA